jgi:hypothetical protein
MIKSEKTVQGQEAIIGITLNFWGATGISRIIFQVETGII